MENAQWMGDEEGLPMVGSEGEESMTNKSKERG